MAIGLLDHTYPVALQKKGSFTVFVPNNRAFRRARGDFPYSRMLRMTSRSRQMIRQHILPGKLTLEDLQDYDYFYTLQGNVAELQVRVAKDVFKYKVRGHGAKAKVVQRDLPASNGMIHVVNELLINDPVIDGDSAKSAMDLIREEGRFNRMQTLIASLGEEASFEKDNITVFAPENGGLDGLPEGTLDYLTTEEAGKAKLRTLLENHIFPGKIPVTELVGLKTIRSIAGYAFNVSISNRGRIQLNKEVNISQADIPCSNAVYYHVDAPLIPDQLKDILPSRCDLLQNTSIQGRCSACNAEMKCPLERDTFTGEVSEGCQYWGKLEGSWTQVYGCKPKCTRTYRIPKCCPGFYGRDCKPCPGGHKNPCGGRGECSDEMFGTGFCLCESNFRGSRCEKCMESNKFGANCTQQCTCMHGQCNGGPSGNGKCVEGSCYSSFRGENCELEAKRCRRGRLLCHVHAECITVQTTKGPRFRCQCQQGYEGDGQLCTEINPCEKPDRGKCHNQAKCSKVGPGAHHCECGEGWYGNGFTCSPVIACNSSDHCHSDATCIDIRPGQYSCKCNTGYEGNGTTCSEVDACLTNNGGCHDMANCTSTGAGTVNCTCPDNYVGDGTRCFTTIAYHIMAHPNLTLVSTLIQKQDPNDVFLSEVGETFTFFAPTDNAMRHFLDERVTSGYFDDEETLMSFFQFHTLSRDYTIQDMLALERAGGYGRMETLFDGYSIRLFIKNKTVNVLSSQTTSAPVVTGDIAALNGRLHIIDGVLEPFLPDANQPFLRAFFQQNPQYSNFGQWLEKKGLIKELQLMDRYTLFVSDNSMFFPEAVNHTITERYLKYYIVPSILLTPALDNMQTVQTLLGERHFLEFTTNGSQVSVNGVNIVKSNILMVEGVVHTIGGILHPVLHFCNTKTEKTVFGLCGPCSQPEELKCDKGFELVESSFIQKYRCRYTISDRHGLQHRYLGCRKLCEQTVFIPACCAGYYGPNCTECQGGPETPCGGRGVCDEKLTGSGQCVCDPVFTGPSCETCLDGNMAGPSCNISKQSCGYNNGNCSVSAQCSDSAHEAGVHCRCLPGYVGDGYSCVSPCHTRNGGCHANATCSLQAEDQTVQCRCKEGFHGNGQACIANKNACDDNNGDCSPYADCRYSPPPVTSVVEGDVTCECMLGYAGNGSLCVTTILDALGQISVTNTLKKILEDSLDNQNVTMLLASHQSAVTLFIPVNLTDIKGIDLNDYVIKDIIVLSPTLVKESNTTMGAIFAVSGLPLPVTLKDGEYYIRDIHVVEGNIPALNGYVHLLASPFQFEQGNAGSSKSSSLELIVILVPVAVVVVVATMAAIAVVCYRRSQASGFLDFVKNFRKGSDASMSFARLKAQESEEDSQSPFSQPDNVNFDNPLYNDPESF